MLQGIHAEVGEFRNLLTGGIDPDDATGVLGPVVLGVEVCGKPSVCARHETTVPQTGRRRPWIRLVMVKRPACQPLGGITFRATGTANRIAATPTPKVTA